MTLTANWSYPTSSALRRRTHRRDGRRLQAAAGITRPLLVTDRGLASSA
jgi:hypothetical protein